MCVCSEVAMKSLAIQCLASIIVFISLSFSQEDGEGRGRPNYVLVDKKINVKEIIRFGRRGDANGEVSEFDSPKDNAESGSSLTSLLTRVSNAINLRKMKNMLPLSGLELSDTGTAIVCGPPGAHLNVSWTPKLVDREKAIKFYLDIVNPIDFGHGQGHIDVYLEDSPDPVFSVDQDIACNDIHQMTKLITCPLKKGNRIKVPFSYSDLSRVPVGAYTIVLKIISYDTNPHALFACLNFTLRVKETDQMLAKPPIQGQYEFDHL